ncbi:MAG: S1 RNA-binding domain-containing protein [Bradymonadia bacterium]
MSERPESNSAPEDNQTPQTAEQPVDGQSSDVNPTVEVSEAAPAAEAPAAEAPAAEAPAEEAPAAAAPQVRAATEAEAPAAEAAPAPAHHRVTEASLNARTPKVGDSVQGRIVKITGNVAFVDYGGKSEGYIELSELRDEENNLTLNEGDNVEAEVVDVRGAVRLSRKRIMANAGRHLVEEAFKSGSTVTGTVTGTNKGGYEVRVHGMRAFCPASQIAEHFVKDQLSMVNKDFEFLITDFGNGGRNLVVSRRKLLEASKAARKEKIKAELEHRIKVGDHLQGRVTEIKDYGAFVDLGGGIEGMIHVSEISHERVGHPREKLNKGDAVEVKVIRVEPAKGRVALSIKALQGDPWTTFAKSLELGQALTGEVVRMQPFGAFVRLAPGVDGLLHVSAIKATERVGHPNEVLKEGTSIDVQVEKIELDKKRIGLCTPEVYAARHTPIEGVEVGANIKGKVVKIEKFGVFLEIKEGVTGLIPNVEMGTDRGTDHSKRFPVGTEIEVKILEVDKSRKRIRLSRKALTDDSERGAYVEYKKAQKNEPPKSLGTFGDLLKAHLEGQK